MFSRTPKLQIFPKIAHSKKFIFELVGIFRQNDLIVQKDRERLVFEIRSSLKDLKSIRMYFLNLLYSFSQKKFLELTLEKLFTNVLKVGSYIS